MLNFNADVEVLKYKLKKTRVKLKTKPNI